MSKEYNKEIEEWIFKKWELFGDVKATRNLVENRSKVYRMYRQDWPESKRSDDSNFSGWWFCSEEDYNNGVFPFDTPVNWHSYSITDIIDIDSDIVKFLSEPEPAVYGRRTPGGPLLNDWDGFGYVIATKNLVENKKKVLYMDYEKYDNPDFSGWYFYAGEDQEYVDNIDNLAQYDITTIIRIDSSVEDYLIDTPSGSAFEWDDEKGAFIQVPFVYEAEDE